MANSGRLKRNPELKLDITDAKYFLMPIYDPVST